MLLYLFTQRGKKDVLGRTVTIYEKDPCGAEGEEKARYRRGLEAKLIYP